MKLNQAAKKLRMLLYKNNDCESLCEDFETTLQLCGCDEFQVTVYETKDSLIVDAYPCIQYIKQKGPSCRIYESIPQNSPLNKNKKRTYYGKRTSPHVKENQERSNRQSV